METRDRKYRIARERLPSGGAEIEQRVKNAYLRGQPSDHRVTKPKRYTQHAPSRAVHIVECYDPIPKPFLPFSPTSFLFQVQNSLSSYEIQFFGAEERFLKGDSYTCAYVLPSEFWNESIGVQAWSNLYFLTDKNKCVKYI